MRVAVVGIGLIGGSVALAVQTRMGAEVKGYDLDPAVLQSAASRGVITQAAGSLEEVVRDAEAVFVAVPVGGLTATIGEVLRQAEADCVVTDVGSTKRSIVAAHDDPRFVGGHPLAGAETAGVEHARAELFDGATWYLTPGSRTSGVLYERLHRLLRGIGARPCAIDPTTHDRILAAVSHLPHVFANVLVGQASRGAEGEEKLLPATGPSFRDATRVAGAPSSVWADIYLSNADALIDELDRAAEGLRVVRRSLAEGDRDAIVAWNETAAADRRRLLERGLAGGPLVELRAAVPNRPGVLAELALELGRAGVNIADMALYPAPDMSEGVVALWVAGEPDAERGLGLITQLGFPVARA